MVLEHADPGFVLSEPADLEMALVEPDDLVMALGGAGDLEMARALRVDLVTRACADLAFPVVLAAQAHEQLAAHVPSPPAPGPAL